MRHHHNEGQPRLKEHIGEHGMTCVFCESDELRLCGRQAETYISCATCGADGPIGVGIIDAVNRYRGRFPITPRSRGL